MKNTSILKLLPVIPLSLLTFSSASAQDSLTVQAFEYASTQEDFSDLDISVFDGSARWFGVADSASSGPNSGTFGDGTVLDYRFVGSDRSNGNALTEHVNGGGTYLTSALTAETFGASGGANTGLDVWTATDPDNVGTFDTTPDSDSWVANVDHVAGGDQIRGVIDVSGLSFAQIYFVYGSYKNAATIDLGTTVAGTDLGTLSLPFDGPDNGRLVIQEVTIVNDGGTYGTINFNYSAQASAGRGRFSGVIIDGTAVPEPSAFLLLGVSGLFLLRRRRG